MASPSQPKSSYLVFLSFRGEDVRQTFLSHLYRVLNGRGIYTYIDSKNLNKGEQISEGLRKAIEESRIAVIVFSENYASSRWCLDELDMIMKRKETGDLIVLPVFYKVEPREVRGGRTSYREAFVNHEIKYGKDSEVVKKWKKALNHAGSLSGWEFPAGFPHRDEAEFVESIVKEISIQLNRSPLDVAKYQVGIDSRVNDLKTKLHIDSQDGLQDERLMIALWAIGGMGKTTLAKALYNSIFRNFEGSTFLGNIRGTRRDSEELVRLQQNLLRQILMTEEITVTSEPAGIKLIQDRLCHKKVLLILDGVDDICQINALARTPDWFGKGSRIIITTTNVGVLQNQALTYEVTALNYLEARELFKKYARGNKNIEIEDALLDSALTYTDRLPLALEVLGSTFCTSRQCNWESILNKFNRSPIRGINDVLKISYDGMGDIGKEIFLHIACFFNGWSRKYVERVLESCDFAAAAEIDDLIGRALIWDENGTLKVHGLIESMGKEIVLHKFPDNPERRSRLWRHEETAEVLSKNEATDAVKAIVLNLPKPEEINLDRNAFAKLNKLRFLIMINVHSSFRGSISLPHELRWFEWPECPASSIEFTSTPKKLAVLAVRRSLSEELGEA